MAKSLVRLDQIRKARDPDDQLTAAEVASIETDAANHLDFLMGMLSQIKRIIHGDDTGKWYDNPVAVFGGSATLKALFSRDIRQADCTVDEVIGDFVYVMGDPVADRDQVRKANPANYDKLPTVGVVISKSADDKCLVQWLGETPALFTGLSTGEIYFLGADSKIAEVPPAPVTVDMFVQPIGVAVAPDRVYIRPEANLTLRKAS